MNNEPDDRIQPAHQVSGVQGGELAPTPRLDVSLDRPTLVRWWVFGLACLTSWLLYLHRYAWGVVKPSVKQEYNLTDTQLGWLDSAFGYTYALGQMPGGAAGDLLGPRAVLAFFSLSWSLLVAALVIANGFWLFFLVRSLFGLAQAGAYPVLNKTTRNWFPLSVRTSVQGVVTSFGRAGAVGCFFLLGTVLMGLFGLGWKSALVVLALPGIGLALLLWIVLRDNPREHPWANTAEVRLVEEDEPHVPGTRPRLHASAGNLFSLGALLLYSFFSSFADQLFVNWLPLFLEEGKGLTKVQMGIYASFPLIGGVLGGIVGGILNDRMLRWTGRRRLSRSLIAFTGKFLAAVLVVVSMRVADGRMVMVVLLAARFFNDWSLPTQWGTITDIGGRAAGTVFGLVNMVGSVAMFTAGPILGSLKQHHGWNAVFLAVAGTYLAAALMWLVIDCTRKLVVDRQA
jgi:sugar phosphate permease